MYSVGWRRSVAVDHQPVGHPLPALRADGAPVAPLIQQQGGQVPLAAYQHGLGHGGQAALTARTVSSGSRAAS